jgi:hypothetical protein
MTRIKICEASKDNFKLNVSIFSPSRINIFFMAGGYIDLLFSSPVCKCNDPFPSSCQKIKRKTSLSHTHQQRTDGERAAIFLSDSPLLNHPIIITITEREKRAIPFVKIKKIKEKGVSVGG